MRAKLAFLLAFICIITVSYLFIDESLTLYVQKTKLFQYKSLTVLNAAVSMLAQCFLWTCLYLYFAKIKKNDLLKMLSFRILLAFAGNIVFIYLLKCFIGRSRPYFFIERGFHVMQHLSFKNIYHSMPSSHSSCIWIIITSLILHNRRWLVMVISLNHYLSDVILGGAIGAVSAIILYKKNRASQNLLDFLLKIKILRFIFS